MTLKKICDEYLADVRAEANNQNEIQRDWSRLVNDGYFGVSVERHRYDQKEKQVTVKYYFRFAFIALGIIFAGAADGNFDAEAIQCGVFSSAMFFVSAFLTGFLSLWTASYPFKWGKE